jgi:hypothetical protein
MFSGPWRCDTMCMNLQNAQELYSEDTEVLFSLLCSSFAACCWVFIISSFVMGNLTSCDFSLHDLPFHF